MVARQQLIRYTIVGLASNALVYLLYLGLTGVGLEPKLAMTLTYAIGVLQAFALNRHWSFRFQGPAAPALVRYLATYLLGYGVNFLGLELFVDRGGLPHEWVQGCLVLVIAAGLYLAQKFWVFPHIRGSGMT